MKHAMSAISVHLPQALAKQSQKVAEQLCIPVANDI